MRVKVSSQFTTPTEVEPFYRLYGSTPWGRMYRSHLAIRKSLTLRLTGVRPFSRSVCTPLFYVKCRCNITSQVIEQFYQDLRDTELILAYICPMLHDRNINTCGQTLLMISLWRIMYHQQTRNTIDC